MNQIGGMLAFVSMTYSIPIFPEAFMTAIEILSLCTSMPIYLVLVIKGCSFLDEVEPNTQNLLQKGRPLYCRLWTCPLLQPVTRVVRTGTDSGLSDLPNERKE